MRKVCLVSQVVSLLFVLKNVAAVNGPDPEGSTGCSKKTFLYDSAHGNGWCWRYCQGNSGPWCYTSKYCKSDEERCANDTKCPYGCVGASEGCVEACPEPSGPTPAKIGEPVGSTGCSKKWPHGRCWRYCKGSTGSWCYTRNRCLHDEEGCAYDETCGGISCEGAAPGCVYKCEESLDEEPFFQLNEVENDRS